jgi:hypothetical protein
MIKTRNTMQQNHYFDLTQYSHSFAYTHMLLQLLFINTQTSTAEKPHIKAQPSQGLFGYSQYTWIGWDWKKL